jgi:hypothetical protein
MLCIQSLPTLEPKVLAQELLDIPIEADGPKGTTQELRRS